MNYSSQRNPKTELESVKIQQNCDTQRNRPSSRDTLVKFNQSDADALKRLATPGYVGPDSLNVYYQKYKQMDKELEEDDQGYSPSTAYISKIRSLKLLPSPLGLIHHQNNNATIKAKNMNLGQNYALALSSSMKYLSNTQVVELPGN